MVTGQIMETHSVPIAKRIMRKDNMTDRLISKLLLVAMDSEISTLEAKFKLSFHTPKAKLQQSSTKYKIAHGQWVALMNFRTLVSCLRE